MTNISKNMGRSLKALGLIVCLGALPLAASLTGCASDRYNQRADQRIEDNRMAERVRAALSADREYKFDDVQVVVFRGDVQLNGSVITRAQRESAGEVARSIAGVRRVDNNIAVRELR